MAVTATITVPRNVTGRSLPNFRKNIKRRGAKALGTSNFGIRCRVGLASFMMRPPVCTVGPREGTNAQNGVCLEPNPAGPQGDGGQPPRDGDPSSSAISYSNKSAAINKPDAGGASAQRNK
jgi:hypothetical protein